MTITKQERADLREAIERRALRTLTAEESSAVLDALDEADTLLATERAAREKAERERDEAQAAAGAMREALVHVRKQALYCLETSGEERDDAVRDLDLALFDRALDADAGAGVLDRLASLQREVDEARLNSGAGLADAFRDRATKAEARVAEIENTACARSDHAHLASANERLRYALLGFLGASTCDECADANGNGAMIFTIDGVADTCQCATCGAVTEARAALAGGGG